MFEIYKISTGKSILSGLSSHEALAIVIRLIWSNHFDFWIRPMA